MTVWPAWNKSELRVADGALRPSRLITMSISNPQQLLAAPCDLEIVRRYECLTSDRYYETRMARDLFGCWCVIVVWGGIGSRHGQLRTFPQVDRTACHTVLDAIEKRRLRRAYIPVRNLQEAGAAADPSVPHANRRQPTPDKTLAHRRMETDLPRL